MYVFWFNANHGTDDTVYCSKVVRVIRNDIDKRKKIFLVELDPEGAIPKKPRKDYLTDKEIIKMKVSREEGEVWRRCFWLENEDYNRAESIVNDYLKSRWLNAQQQADRLRGRVASI